MLMLLPETRGRSLASLDAHLGAAWPAAAFERRAGIVMSRRPDLAVIGEANALMMQAAVAKSSCFLRDAD